MRVILIVALLITSQLPIAAADRPNILFIFSDDQSYKTVSCYPEALPGVRTPAIDALAKTGFRFTHAYMGAWCMPSRATLLTGRQPHGIESMRMSGKYPAFNELNDPSIQEQRMLEDNLKKKANGLEPLPVDTGFRESLKRGLPPTAGISVGLERLFMALYNEPDISQLKWF